MNYTIDTSCWIEYLEGSSKGEKINQIIKDKDNIIYSSPLIISEVISKVKRKKHNFNIAFNVITSTSNIVNLNAEESKEAGLLHAEIKQKIPSFSLADAIIIISARKNSAKLLTIDAHFKIFKEAILI